jgi:hypothetical protein
MGQALPARAPESLCGADRIRRYKRRIGFAPVLCVDGPVHTDGSRRSSLAYAWTDGLVCGLPGLWPMPPIALTKSRRPLLKVGGVAVGASTISCGA